MDLRHKAKDDSRGGSVTLGLVPRVHTGGSHVIMDLRHKAKDDSRGGSVTLGLVPRVQRVSAVRMSVANTTTRRGVVL
jgi:hypothetical protein